MQKILLIDDDLVILEVFGLILTKKGYDVTTASTSDEAKNLLESNYDYIFVDYNLYDETAEELIKEIFKYFTPNKLCVVTGEEDLKVYKELKNIGVVNCLKKPITAMQMIKFINEKTI